MVETGEGQSFIKVLSNRSFLVLWFSQLNSQLADRIFVYVLMILAYNLTKSNLGVSVPLLAFGIPSVLFGPLAGVFVDKWNRKAILSITSLMRGLLILLIVPLIEQSLALIFLVSFLIYTATQFFAPAESASIPELVKKKDLIVANSLFMITWMASSVIGFGLGAPLVNYFGNEGTFIFAAALGFGFALALGAAFFVLGAALAFIAAFLALVVISSSFFLDGFFFFLEVDLSKLFFPIKNLFELILHSTYSSE